MMEIFTYIASVTSILSFLFYLYERIMRKRLIRDKKAQTWSQISKVKGVMKDIEEGLKKSSYENNDMYLQAHSALATILNDLFKEAILLEKKFDLTTIKRWRTVGKISSNWQQKLVLNLLETKAINFPKSEDPEKYQEYQDWDESDSNIPIKP